MRNIQLYFAVIFADPWLLEELTLVFIFAQTHGFRGLPRVNSKVSKAFVVLATKENKLIRLVGKQREKEISAKKHERVENGNCSKVLPEAHFIVQGHAKQCNGILYRKRELVISFSQDHSLMFIRIYNHTVIGVPHVGSIQLMKNTLV